MDEADKLLNKVRYFSHMYWKGRMSADAALFAFAQLDELIMTEGYGPTEWEGMM